MDPKDLTAAVPPVAPEGGVGMSQPVYVAPSVTVPPQVASVPQEDTIVIPAAASPESTPVPSANPFVPDVHLTATGGEAPPKSGDNPLFRRVLMIGVAVLVLVGVIFGVRTLFAGKATPKNVTINYWGLWENDSVTRGLIAEFEKLNPDITVQYTQQSPKQYRERLQSAINRGEGPDAFRFHNTWIPMLRLQLATVPPAVMTPAEFNSTFFPVTANNLISGSSIFGLPLMIDGLGLYVNDDLFSTAGVTPPISWTDVASLVPKLTVKNGSTIVTSAIALGTATNVEHFSDILGLLFYQNGADLTNLSGNNAEQTLTFYRSFADPTNPMYTWSDAMDNSVPAFAAGKVAMILAPSWRAHEVVQMSPKLRFHIVPVPQLQGTSVAWASYWVEGVSSQSQHKAAAWQFIKFITSKNGANILYSEAAKTRLFGEPYARMDLADLIQNDPYTGAYVKQAPFSRSFPIASRTYDNGLNDHLIQYLTDAVNSMATGASPIQVLQTVSAGFRQVLSSYGLGPAQQVTPTP